MDKIANDYLKPQLMSIVNIESVCAESSPTVELRAIIEGSSTVQK